MTVTYSKYVPNTSFCAFTKLLFRWRGSVFKLVLPELAVYLAMYYLLSCLYRFGLPEESRRTFEKVALVCDSFSKTVPLSFVLGFYVTIVVTRWWDQYMLIPWPDDICILAATYINGQDERSRSLRRAFVRYINLAFVLTFSSISRRVGVLYPTLDHLMSAGYITVKEKEIIEMMDEASPNHKIWLPLSWACLLIAQARREGRLIDDHGQKALAIEITNLRYHCGKLQEYNMMSVPLVYTQVVTMSTYSFFLSSIIGQQFLDPKQEYPGHEVDYYVPIFIIMQYIFYMGWLRVADSLLNPFGDDDDDFDVIEFLDRHFEVSFVIVDDMMTANPEFLQEFEIRRASQTHCIQPDVGIRYTKENPKVIISNEIQQTVTSTTFISEERSTHYRQRLNSARRTPSPIVPNVW